MATNTKHCTICASDLKDFTKISPQDHERAHNDDERACGQCWEAWLSLQVEEKQPEEIECLFCKSIISEASFVKLARDATKRRYIEESLSRGETALLTSSSYSKKKEPVKSYNCMARCKGSLQGTQTHDRLADGRIFTCHHCSFRVCTACDRPEHTSETCSEYRECQEVIHGQAEALSLNTLKAFKTCPDCNAAIEPLKSACHTQCTGCGFQFCSGCMVQWVGEGSAYLLGKDAHTGKCKYRTRDAESTHSLGNRWEQTRAVKERLSAKAEKKAARDEDRKRSRAEAESGKSTDRSGTERPAKKCKKA
jgi:hypothetical protein